MMGWGRLMLSKTQSRLVFEFSTGMYFSISYVFVMGSLGYLEIKTLCLFVALGLICFVKTSNLSNPCVSILDLFKRNYLFLLVIFPYLLILFIRCSAPPYFIDYIQYHLPLCQEYLNHRGFVDLPHFYLGTTTSNFGGESLLVFPLAIKDVECAMLFSFTLFVMLLLYVREIFKEDKLVWMTCALILMGGEVFFHSVVYGKTEVMVLIIILDIVAKVIFFKHQRSDYFLLGLAMLFLPFSKVSSVLLLLPLLVFVAIHAYKKIKITLVNLGLLIMGSLVPSLLFVTKNLITHGMCLYPFMFDPAKLPSELELGPRYWVGSESSDHLAKMLDSLSRIFFQSQSYAFSFNYMAYFFLAGVFLALIKRNYTYLMILALSVAHMWYWVLSYKFYESTIRLSFPGWIFTLIALGFLLKSIKSYLWRQIWLGSAIIPFCLIIYHQGRFLPGLKLHLNKQSYAEYYRNLSIPLGAVFYEHIQNISEDKRIAISSEAAGVVLHAGAVIVNRSSLFDKKPFSTVQEFLSVVHQEKFDYIVIDEARAYTALGTWSKVAFEMQLFDCIVDKEGVRLYKVL